MKTLVERLKRNEEILALIDQRRAETGEESVGANIGRSIIDMNLMELEREILDNPGALEPWLVRRGRECV